MHKVLEKRLKRIGWQHKQSLYEPVFDGYSCLAEVKKPKITVIVISWKWNPLTLKNFQELEKQRKDVRFELIFVNNGAEESDFADLKPYVNKWINLNENTGAYLARNVGAVFADGPILLFLEDDGVPANDLIKSHLKVHAQYYLHVLRGVYQSTEPENKKKNRPHYYLGDGTFPMYADVEGNTTYRCQPFYAIGGWDDNIKFGGGGIDISLRLFLKYRDKRLQAYSGLPVIVHDYSKSDAHLQAKRAKQKKSREKFAHKYPYYEDYLKSWKDFMWNYTCLIPNNFIGGIRFKTMYRVRMVKDFWIGGNSLRSKAFTLF